MSFHNPKMPWSELEQVLSGRPDGRSGKGRPRGERHLHVVDPLAVDADGGDSPAWSRKRQEYAPPELPRPDDAVPYAELHAHSNFSFLDGASHPEELAEEAARLGLTALAVTDHDGFYGVVRFAEAARALHLPTVIGAELSLGLPGPQNGEPDPHGAHLLVLIPVGEDATGGLPAEALVRSVFAARDRMPPATLVAVPLARRRDEISDALLRARVAAAYGVTHLLSTEGMLSGAGLRVLVPRELAYDSRDGQWRWREDIPPRNRKLALSQEEIDDLLDRGFPLPEWHTPPAVAKELARARPPRRHRGLVIFLTGLSGSGKSTIARGLADHLREGGDRTITLLDGDIVRRELSAGLGFSKADRDLNVRRIGWVAAEIARHRGVGICCPIAPYAAARATAREMAHAAGAGFLLVHVATPLEVCEQRDRKGLYARARAGLITGMTGIDDPYEEPTDADLVVDTTDMTVEEAVQRVMEHLTETGWVEPRLQPA
ncbi:hypothetical protein GCM10027452_36080 [Micromonospora halotolerans]